MGRVRYNNKVGIKEELLHRITRIIEIENTHQPKFAKRDRGSDGEYVGSNIMNKSRMDIHYDFDPLDSDK